MLLTLLPSVALRVAVAAATTPAPVGLAPVPAVSAPHIEQVSLQIFDVNHADLRSLKIGVDGSVDPQTDEVLQHLLRCKRTDHEHAIKPATLKMLAAVGARYPGRTIEIVSAYRAAAKESKTTKHRAGAAIDFRVLGESTVEIRDWLWRTYRDVGIGWYPNENFIHMDSRPDMGDMTWTFSDGKNRYHPEWARRARENPAPSHQQRSREKS